MVLLSRACHGPRFPRTGTRAGCGAGAVRDGPALLGAGADFWSRDRLRNPIYNESHLNFGIKTIECMKKSEPAPKRPEPEP